LFWQVDGSPGDRRLIVQWNDLVRSGEESTITFQAVLHESDGAIEFNYLDVDGDFDDPYYFQYSVQGIKGPGEQDLTGNMLLLGASGLNQFSQSGVSVRIATSQAPSPAAPGEPVVLVAPDDELWRGKPDSLNLDGENHFAPTGLARLDHVDQQCLNKCAVDFIVADETLSVSPLRARHYGRRIGVAQISDAVMKAMVR
jgi:hypothetical protein